MRCQIESAFSTLLVMAVIGSFLLVRRGRRKFGSDHPAAPSIALTSCRRLDGLVQARCAMAGRRFTYQGVHALWVLFERALKRKSILSLPI